MKLLKLTPLALLLVACASTQEQATTSTTAATPQQPAQTATPATTALDPVGDYEFATMVEGQTVTGTLHITGAPGSYTGRIVTNMFPEFPVTGVTVEGNVITITAAMPDDELRLRLVMEGMNFKGAWYVGDDTGEFNGKKLPKS